jgi:polynucleotide 5'-hydroxyl-kinase GRC3/NOL9
MEPVLDLAPGWPQALAAAAATQLTLVLGPMDVGKSSFIRALAGLRPGLVLIDLDPGQKMIGPPGSASLGTIAPEPRLERFIFLGSTAVGAFGPLLGAARALAASAGKRPIAVNTSGYVTGPGANLQRLTVDALRPDLIVGIGLDAGLGPAGPMLKLAPSPSARRKTSGRRRALRQFAFDAAMSGAGARLLDPAAVTFAPAEPAVFAGDVRPVCSLADAAGEDMAIAILCGVGSDAVRLFAPAPPRPVRFIRLGAMWAGEREGGWRLLERLAPAWSTA